MGGVWVAIAEAANPDDIYIESLAEASTQNDIDGAPVTKFEQAVDLKGGEYEILLHMENQVTATNRAVAAELFIDGAQFQGRFSRETKDVRDYIWSSKTGKITLSQGQHVFRLDFGRDYGTTGGAFARLRNVTLRIRSVR